MCLLHPEDGKFSPWSRSPTSGLQSKDKGDEKNFVLIWSDARKLKGLNLYPFFLK